MSYFEPPQPGMGPSARLENAEAQIEAEEEFAQSQRLAREAIRARGGGPVRRALARIWPSLRPDPPDEDS